MRKVRKGKLPTTTRRVVRHICPLCDKPVDRIHDHLKKSPHWIEDENEYRALLKKKVLYEPGIPVKPLLKSNIVQEIMASTKISNSIPLKTNDIQESIPSKTNDIQKSIRSTNDIQESIPLTNDIQEPGPAEPAEDFETCLGKYEKYLLSISGGRKSVKNAFDEKSQIRTLAKLCSNGEPPTQLSQCT